MTALSEDDIIRLVGGMPGVAVVTASEAGGAPEAAWGDSFSSTTRTATPRTGGCPSRQS